MDGSIQKLPLGSQYQGWKLRQFKREGMIALYEVFGQGRRSLWVRSDCCQGAFG